MTAHTPGPWKAVKSERLVSVYGPDCCIYSAALDPENLKETHTRQWADARLIAAAPRMLALIQRAADIADGKAIDRQFEDDCRAVLKEIKG